MYNYAYGYPQRLQNLSWVSQIHIPCMYLFLIEYIDMFAFLNIFETVPLVNELCIRFYSIILRIICMYL